MADNTNTAPKAKTEKKPKKKGPIRWEAILPFGIFVALVYVYFAFFFDMHLRRGLEFGGTYANGAEVNVGDVDTSFWKASLSIKNIQVTDVDEPKENKVQVGEIRWRMLWDALLRGKVVIADASILEIGVGTPRKTPGRVLPKPPPDSESASEGLREKALEQAQKQFEGNVLGDVAAMLDGADPKDQLKNMEASLSSALRVKELQAELKNKEQEWKTRIDALPQSKEIKAYETRIKAVKIEGLKTPQEIQASVKELDTLYKEIDAKVKETEATGKALNGDVNTYQKSISDLEAMVKKDIDDIENRLQIPKLDVKNLAGNLFGGMILTKVKQAKFYMEKARHYMPPKKTPEEKAEHAPPKPKERIAGRNYKFGRPNSYPLFWLQNAAISSKSAGSDFSGDVTGTLKNLTDDPPVIGVPTTLKFEGDFPKQEMRGVLGEIIVDHTTEKPMEQLTLKVADFRVKGQTLVDSSDVKLGFQDARGLSELKVQLQQENVEILSNSAFSNVAYDVGAKSKIVQEILNNVMKSVSRVTLDAGVKGTWTNLDFDVESNLGRELQAGFERELQAKIAEARAKIRAFVDEKIGAEKAKLTAEYKKIEDKIKGEIAGKQGEINKFKAQIDDAKNKAVKEQGKKVETEAKKGLENLLKGKKLKF